MVRIQRRNHTPLERQGERRRDKNNVGRRIGNRARKDIRVIKHDEIRVVYFDGKYITPGVASPQRPLIAVAIHVPNDDRIGKSKERRN